MKVGEVVNVERYWCPTCGMVRDDLLVPLCRHGVPDPNGLPREMDPIPRWHPLYSRKAPLAR